MSSMKRAPRRVPALMGLAATGALGLLAAPPSLARGQAAALPEGIERVTTVEGITEYKMPANGLHILLFPDPSKQTATVNVTYLVGSRNENYGETGMAHLLEHLMFKGSTHHTNIPQELTEHGARPNGSTYFDRTNYFETFQATDVNLDWALDLEADRMVNSFIARKDLDSEMTVVRNEYESGENSPNRILSERVQSTAYLWHNYGKSTIGARADIEKVPIERLQGFWRMYYQPDNAYIIVSGKIDEAKTLGLIKQKFGPIPRPTRVIQPTYTDEPTQDGERSVTLRRVGDIQVAIAGYHIPASSHPDAAAVNVLAQILGDEPSGRLYKALVETKKAARVSASSDELRDPGLLMASAEVAKDASLDAARDALLATVESFANTPPTQEEVDRIRTQQLKEIELLLNNSERVGVGMSELIASGDWRLLFVTRDRLQKVTPADVQRVAKLYLKPSNRTLGLFVPTDKPDRSEIPATPDVASLVKDYKSDVVVATGEAFDPSPANIESRVTRPAPIGGVKLALLPKKTRGAIAQASLTLRFGDETSLMNRVTAGELTGEMLMRGTTKHTRQQLQDAFDKLKARVRVNGGATSVRASIEATRENLPAVMQLVGEVLREPAFPEKEFDTLKQEQVTAIEQQKSDPISIARTALARHMSPYPKGDVRYVMTPDEEIAAIKATTLDDVKKFYADFYGASNGELAVVGDFDAQTIPTLTTQLLGTWKSPRAYTRVPRPYQDISPVNQGFETPDKTNAIFLATAAVKIKDDDADYPALALGNYILGGGFLNSRLATRIRQKEGLSYGVGSQFSGDPLDSNSAFMAYAIYAPQNEAKVEAAFNEELARAIKDGFTPEEIAAAKTGFLQSRQVGRAQDNSLSSALSSDLFLGRTLAFDADFEQKVNALTAEQVSTAMRKYFDPSRVTIIKAGDFAKSAKPAGK